ncbi:hypothetical protein JM18_006577 [Phytophthora kernoviae]|uniref:AAA+ ATPase domain-containing protein n=2 Tax=Phytophthora kernoviae TaxID=325452 RepID=A0A921SCL3_9STRA|nr:hypothetical protein G195_008879 [Phytophthora kernoviae 00238/432]KAG2519873.1 hypothetical protein JM18_006577 [Phytophthora kernoviae]
MPVLWPACVYKSFSAAVQHTHDVWALRSDKPVLDAEDRVVYFFGVGPRACHVLASGSAPNLQLCVVHEDDLHIAPWSSSEDFTLLCGKHQVPEDLVRRAQNNACFLRACDEATAYRTDVQTDEQASKLFVTLLKGAKQAHTTGKAVVAREMIMEAGESPVKTPVKSQKTKAVANTPVVTKVLKTPAMEIIVAKCWQQMLEKGWETMTQANGQVLYKMPGTSFFECIPNVNFFDSLEKACARYLRDWAVSASKQPSDSEEFSDLTTFVWPMAIENGWETMASNTETWYKKADTPFDQWVPNVTIFRSKAHAVAKYLEESGLAGSSDGRAEEEETLSTTIDYVDSDVELEELEESNNPEQEEESQSFDEESQYVEAPEELSDEQSSSEEEENQPSEQKGPAKIANSSSSRKLTTKPQKAVKKPQPAEKIKITKRPAKQPIKAVKKQAKPHLTIPAFQMTFGKTERELKSRGWYWKNGGLDWMYYQPYCKTKEKASLTQNVDYFCGRDELEIYLNDSGLNEIIREKLYAEHYYDYFKPHCETSRDGEAGVDYFQSKELLIEYLERSGLWDEAAARVRAEAALDSEDDSSNDEAPTLSHKREREERTPAPQNRSKKNKTGSAFHTSIESSRSLAADLSEDDEAMGETISPDTVKEKEVIHGGGPLSRNLVNSFTPSPGAARKEKSSQHMKAGSMKELSPQQIILAAIQKLSSGYTPANFRHREKEFNEIRDFFHDRFQEETKTSLYISGAPGCGKTALLKATEFQINELYRECCPEQGAKEPIRSHINAMALADSTTLFCQLAQTLTSKQFANGNEAFEAIERATNRRLKTSRTMILILDEIDVLLKNNGIENDMYRLFELAHRASHSFILIGIANQVDFTERHLPMLQQRSSECSPRVVIFEPYKHPTIEQILIQRLGGETVAPKMVSLHGISFLARKIASTTGDIRLAVDTCRRILQHKLDSCDKENAGNGSDDQDRARPLPLTDMLRIVKHALESKSAMIIRNLPRNLQMILFASTRLLIVTANRAAANGDSATPLFSENELYTCYCEVSKDAGVFQPLAERDFRTALETLSSEGLIAQPEFKRHLIKLLFSTSELLQSFRKDPFFSRLV